MDPRVKTPASDLDAQFKYSKQLYDDAVKLAAPMQELTSIRAQIDSIKKQKPAAEVTAALDALSQKLQEVGGGGEGRGRRGGREENMGGVRSSLLGLMGIMQDADVAPTKQATDAIGDLEKSIPTLLEKWSALKSQDVTAANTVLRNAKLPELKPQQKSGTEQELEGNEE